MRKKDQSTEFLKGCLADALFKLLREKDYDKITVGEIVASANVSRATYYRYFQSKDELLLYKINHLTDEWLGTVEQQETLSFERFLALYLQLIYDNRSYSGCYIMPVKRAYWKSTCLTVLLLIIYLCRSYTGKPEKLSICWECSACGFSGILRKHPKN